MQRKDVVIGTEYCATAPLAYGAEPSTHPRRVRFTSTAAGPWGRLITEQMGGDPDYPDDWRQVESQIVRKADILPGTPTGRGWGLRNIAKRTGETTVTYWTEGEPKGALPAEIWSPKNGGGWVETLTAPAEVHRTWAQFEQDQAEAVERRRQHEATARVPELQALLESVGLAGLFEVSMSGSGMSGRVQISLYETGDKALADLTAWAESKGLDR